MPKLDEVHLRASGDPVPREPAPTSARVSAAPREPEPRRPHLRPVWIVLILLLPCLALTVYYSQTVVPSVEQSDSFLPSTGYAFVLLLINLDLIGFVVLTLLLSRNLIKAYFERRHRLVGSGFRAKLVAAFIGFALIPTVLLALVASGLVKRRWTCGSMTKSNMS
jgi:two-component system nitrogen regulation sensor histidine kinase NtrY